MEYVLKIDITHKIEIIELPEKHDYKWYSEQIGCDWIEIVRPRYFNHVLIVDEEGRMKPNHINLLASAMYGTFEHGEPIVGDVLIVDEGLVNGKPDIIGFSFEKATQIKEKLEEEKENSIKYKRMMEIDQL